jgi:hypothetical protein
MNRATWAFTAATAVLAAACGWSLPIGGGSCDYNDDCPWENTGIPGTLTPPPSPSGLCGSTADCRPREVCDYGRCMFEVGRCASDDECAPSATCIEGLCSCTSDYSCGGGLACQPNQASGDYYSAENQARTRCVVCLDGGGCERPTCDVDGSCPGNLICNRQEAACELPPRRIACAQHADCPPRMSCGDDSYCVRGPRRPPVADGGTDASGDAGSDAALDSRADG